MITRDGKVIGNVARPNTLASIESNLDVARTRGDSYGVALLERELRITKLMQECSPSLDELDGKIGAFGKLAEIERKIAKVDAEFRASVAKFQKLDSDVREHNREVLAHIARTDTLVASKKAEIVRRAELRKSRAIELRTSYLRAELRKADAIRRSGRFARFSREDRWAIEKAERNCRSELAKLEAQQRARKSIKVEAHKNRAAMVKRGVTFDRMARGQ